MQPSTQWAVAEAVHSSCVGGILLDHVCLQVTLMDVSRT